MKKVLQLVLIVFCLNNYAQEGNEEDIVSDKEIFADAEYFLFQGFYIDALTEYQKLFNLGYESNANINYRVGICYLNIPGQKEKSIQYFLNAAPLVSDKFKRGDLREEFAPFDLYIYLGNAYRVTDQLDLAIEAYNKYKTFLKKPKPGDLSFVDQQIRACQTAQVFMASPSKVKLKNLGEPINNSNANYNAVVSGDGKTIVYMSTLPFYEGIFVSKLVNGNWGAPVNITPEIQSDGNQTICDISHDGTQLLLRFEDEFDADIYISEFDDKENKWSVSTAINEINTSFWESHASFSEDGKTIYFSSNRMGGYGEMDIYKTEKSGLGWGKPENLGPVVNSILSEDTPFLVNETNLYFSSQSYVSMGGFDVFLSTYQNGGWTQPKNLQYPLNSTDDDLFYYPMDSVKGYMARFEDDGFGFTDIYVVNFKETEAAEELTVVPVTQTDTVKPAEKEKIEVKVVSFEIKPIYFDFNKTELNAKAKEELKYIADFMKKYPECKLLLIGHTDATGELAYNLSLSEQRALTAMQYLVEQGIEAQKLKAIGKGEAEPVALNSDNNKDLPEGRAFNRRVEFEISGIDSKTVVLKKINNVPDNLKIKQ